MLPMFQCSSASRKFLNFEAVSVCVTSSTVSVLFSEPKIPQWGSDARSARTIGRFSALQRAENSSILFGTMKRIGVIEFQCSSASRKFLNWFMQPIANDVLATFQCSSASRKFLNQNALDPLPLLIVCFSALQRAENSSIC